MHSDATEKDGRLSRGRQTRQRLINAALRLFAEKGYASVGIREVAAGAETNIASISFHFANKEGLYKAVIEHVAEELARMHHTAIDAARREAVGTDTCNKTLLVRIIENMIATSLTSKRSQWMSLLLQREFIDPTEYFTTIYDTALQPTLALFMELLHDRGGCGIDNGIDNGDTSHAQPLRNKALSFILFIISSAYMRNKNTFLHFIGKPDYDPADIREVARVVADFVANGLFSSTK